MVCLNVLYHIGETYRRLGLYKESLSYFNRAISLDKNDYFPYLGKALIYHVAGDRRKCLENIQRAEEFSQDSERNQLEVKIYKEIFGF